MWECHFMSQSDTLGGSRRGPSAQIEVSWTLEAVEGS